VSAGTSGTDTVTTELGFLQTILADPGDDAHRLVYADWLDERDDPRGRHLRIEVRLAELSEQDPASPALDAEYLGLRAGLEPGWRAAVGKRYDLLLESYLPQYKIQIIKVIRELSWLGLKEAKDLSETLPAVIPTRGRSREQLEPLRAQFAAGTRVALRPAADSASAALEVQLRALEAGFRPDWLPGSDRRYDLVLEKGAWGYLGAHRLMRQHLARLRGESIVEDPGGDSAEPGTPSAGLPDVFPTGLTRAEAVRLWGQLQSFAVVSLRESPP
jgi:uncharacterized protein (TIGR02996 family)